MAHVCMIEGPSPPAWVDALVSEGAEASPPRNDGLAARVRMGDRVALAEVRVPGADGLADDLWQRCVMEAYRAIFDSLRGRSASHPIRYWNFVPHIHRKSSGSANRYMLFNAGRHAAFAERPDQHEAPPPAASAVGCGQKDLVVFALAADKPAHVIENPRQIPAYQYSTRYGPIPPAFSRGAVTKLDRPDQPATLLITSGTASVVGEDSQHPDDLDAQLRELCRNLHDLLDSARRYVGPRLDKPRESDRRTEPRMLARFTELRAYVSRETDLAAVSEALQRACPDLRTLELMPAEICRAELLVEVEGVAVLDPVWPGPDGAASRRLEKNARARPLDHFNERRGP